VKTVKLEKEVEDISGLYFDLITRGFELISVSVHERCTYVNVEDEEEKDPTMHMEAFVGAPFRTPSRSVLEKRREIGRKFLEEKPLRMENLRARFRVGQEVKAIAPAAVAPAPVSELVSVIEDRPVEILALPAPAGNGLWKKLRKLW
jgi:hypothetical protein